MSSIQICLRMKVVLSLVLGKRVFNSLFLVKATKGSPILSSNSPQCHFNAIFKTGKVCMFR